MAIDGERIGKYNQYQKESGETVLCGAVAAEGGAFMDAKLRKHRYKLMYSGYAVIAFGVWSIIRMFLMKYLDPLGLTDMIGGPDDGYEELAFILMIVGLLIDLLFRLYVGRSAIREGRGRCRRITYVVFAILYTVIYVWSDGIYLARTFREGFSANVLATAIVDLSTCVAMAEIIVSSLSIRRLGKES